MCVCLCVCQPLCERGAGVCSRSALDGGTFNFSPCALLSHSQNEIMRERTRVYIHLHTRIFSPPRMADLYTHTHRPTSAYAQTSCKLLHTTPTHACFHINYVVRIVNTALLLPLPLNGCDVMFLCYCKCWCTVLHERTKVCETFGRMR